MSILKSILHRWNKDSKSYDTLHPETEVAQITDWSQGIVNTLASTALGSLISTLSSDSLMAKLMKLVLDASGVKYLIDTNGYVCFGSLFGGLIIQWGASNEVPADNGGTIILNYPISFTTFCNPILSSTEGKINSTANYTTEEGASIRNVTLTNCQIYSNWEKPINSSIYRLIIIGK